MNIHSQNSKGRHAVSLFARTDAFTLIELLVVVAIIAGLVAISLPVLSSARNKADQANCVSNLRQIVAASHLAAADNDGKFPNMHGYSWEQGDVWIADALAPYLNGTVGKDPTKLLRCPATEKNAAEAWLKDPQYAHYKFNIWYAQNKLPQVGNTTAMLFFDTAWQDWTKAQFSHSPGSGAYVNVAYVDGHVAAMKYAEYEQLNPSGDESQNDFFKLGWIK